MPPAPTDELATLADATPPHDGLTEDEHDAMMEGDGHETAVALAERLGDELAREPDDEHTRDTDGPDLEIEVELAGRPAPAWHCRACRGSGLHAGEPCTSCAGTGGVAPVTAAAAPPPPPPEPVELCWFCAGTGRDAAKPPARCTRCDGTGRKTAPKPAIPRPVR